MKRFSIFLVFSIIAFGSVAASAQGVNVDDLLAKIDKRTEQYAKLIEILEGTDPVRALAAFDVMVGSGDKTLFETAISSALASTDSRLRARALWETISRRDNIIIELDREKIPKAEEAREALTLLGENRSLPLFQKLPDKQCINLYQSDRCYPGYQVTVSGLSVDIRYKKLWQEIPGMAGKFEVTPDGVLVGSMVMAKFPTIKIPAKINLR